MTDLASAQFLERMRSGRRKLLAVIDRLTPEQLTAIGPEGWAIKDHLAHLAAWARKETAVLEGRSASEGLGLPENTYETHDFDEINDMLNTRHQEMSLEAALAAFHASHEALLAATAALPAGRLNERHPNSRPGNEYRWADTIAGNSYGHDEEHLPWIEALIPRQG